jgi:sortase (surface protein transpeptidase)
LLAIKYQSRFSIGKILLIFGVFIILSGGAYITLLFMSPSIAHRFFIQPVVVGTLPKPKDGDNRLVIPALGVNISYGTGSSMLVQNAQWRESKLSNPEDGGTMLLAAHKFSLQTTPQQTITKSPLYALDTLRNGDKLIIDYRGVRYAYEVTNVRTGKIGDAPLPTNTSDDHLVVYTYDSENDTTRTVVIAKPLGKVAL